MFGNMPPQGFVALIFLAFVGGMMLLSKLFTRLWLYALLASPSWGVAFFNLFNAVQNGEPTGSIALNFFFILQPIDMLVADPSLSIFALALLGVWTYIIASASVKLAGGWGLPLTPIIVWILGLSLIHI